MMLKLLVQGTVILTSCYTIQAASENGFCVIHALGVDTARVNLSMRTVQALVHKAHTDNQRPSVLDLTDWCV